MPRKIRALALITIATAFASITSTHSVRCPVRAQGEPASTQSSWPDLSSIRVSQTQNKLCSLDGDARRGSEQANINRLINRFHLPDSGFEESTLEEMLKLRQGDVVSKRTIINFPTSASPLHQKAVSVVGYVIQVSVLGCGYRSDDKEVLRIKMPLPGTESSNCRTNDLSYCNIQILLTPDLKLSRRNGRNIFVVEVTPRSRILAARNLLVSNVGTDWSVGVLRKKLIHHSVYHRVRFSGWLYFDAKYLEHSWASDPNNEVGKPNARETAWELHPVMGIERLDSVPRATAKRSSGRRRR